MRKINYILIFACILLGACSTYAAETKVVKKTGYYVDKNANLIPNDKNENKKVVLITIDDGPSKRAEDMMKTLAKHNAKAIFFINGIHDKDNKGVIEAEYKAGFTIGNHTWSHKNLKKENVLSVVNSEINDNSKLIKKITGSEPKFFRPPYGASTSYVRSLATKNGMIFMNWSGAALDWEKDAEVEKVFVSNVMDKLHDGEIILIHEHPWSAKYLDSLLTEIEKKGYTFLDPNQITN